MIDKVCQVCAKPYRVYPCQAKSKYCSRDCQGYASQCPLGCTCSKHATQVALTCQTCGAVFRVPPSLVGKRKYCAKDCYTPTGGHYDKTGDKNPKWRGGRTVDKQGRVMIYAPGDPHATMYGGIYAYEYRLIAAKKIGRPLAADEVVHHIDGDAANNAPENLQVMTPAEHASLHSLAWHEADRLRITHCKNGHPFDDNNTVLKEDGKTRMCRICKNANARASHHRRKAARAQQTP